MGTLLSGEELQGGNEIFIGREKEIAQLDKVLEYVIQQRKLRLVLVQGDYGVGKTTLVDYFIEISERKYHEINLRIGRGIYPLGKENEGYLAFRDALKDLLKGYGRSRRERLNLDDARDLIKEIAPAWLGVIPVAGSAVGALVQTGFSVHNIVSKTRGSPFSQEHVLTQYANVLREISKEKPMIMFLDDVQWADESSLNLLCYLINTVQDCPIMIIAAYRPVEALETGIHAKVFRDMRGNLIERKETVELELIEGIEVGVYLDERYTNNQFPERVKDLFNEITEGHPFYLEQLCSHWEEMGNIVKGIGEDGRERWYLSEESNPGIALPSKIGEIIEARFRNLSERMRDILTVASVEGDEFIAQTIAKTLEISDLIIFKDLRVLENNYRLVNWKEKQEQINRILDFYRFAHRVIREHAYQEISAPERRLYHRKVGEVLEVLYDGDIYSISGQLSRHFEIAEDHRKAAQYALGAAEYEKSHYAWKEAKEWCIRGIYETKKALEAEVDKEMLNLQFSLQIFLGECHYYSGEVQEAYVYMREGIKASQGKDIDSEMLAGAYDLIATVCDDMGNYQQGLDYIVLGKALLSELSMSESKVLLLLHASEALIISRLGRAKESVKIIEKVIEVSQKYPSSPEIVENQSVFYNILGVAFSYLSLFDRSIWAFDKAIELGMSCGELETVSIAYANKTEDLIALGEYGKAAQASTKALTLAKRCGDRDNESYALYTKGINCIGMKEYEKAVDYIEQSIVLAEELGSVASYHYADLGFAYYYLMENEKASECLYSALELANTKSRKGYALWLKAKILTSHGKWSDAKPIYGEALALLKEEAETDHEYYLVKLKQSFGEELINHGEEQQGKKLIQETIDSFEFLNIEHEIDYTRKIYNNIIDS